MRTLGMIAAALVLMGAGCGYSEEQSAVRDAYIEVAGAFESGDHGTAYDRLSSNTRALLEDLAYAFRYYGTPMGSDGRELLENMLTGVDMSDLSRQITSITVSGSAATLVTATEDGPETLEFVLEDGVWKLDFEDALRDGLAEGMAGSGMSIDDFLACSMTGGGEGLSTGTGTAPVTITNGLAGYDIWYAYVDPSSSPWGDDRLGADILHPGQTLTVWVDPGTYDMKVEDVDGDTYSLYEVGVGSSGFEWEVTLSDMDGM